ncbi:vWA domain-containing protein [Vibrio algarum]|uniref:VWA domain-containing protein n=1 Tax=Vibrio algarum TaxID=3020714 RepID=A0ABT4YWF3_9VIBR|nr:VWA domain-containing protein [Vibrio sp. KJ40-1]MDB1125800.1 VWA domain-containing protein [Vibrio sp. KJ40-1]
MHFEFMWWWMLLLFPLPLLIYFVLPPVKENAAISLPYLPEEGSVAAPSNILAKSIAIFIWLLLIISCARPVWYGDPIENRPKHRDMMLVVDLSGSMNTKDMAFEDQHIDRLTAVKHVLSDFIQKRKGDRLGLVLFADHAYLQTPLTLDRDTIASQLNQTVLGLVGNMTAIGEGIGLATKTFIDGDAPQRVMILLSDGENTSGVLDPIKAAEIAKKYQTTIYTIGLGAGEMVVQDFFMTRKVNTAKDLDEESLTKIAEMTGGEYFRARNQDDLQNIYDKINGLEPVSGDIQTWRPQTEWFAYPLSLALILSFLLVVWRKIRV